MNYYEHHIGDYAEATAHLSFVEDAAYSRLIRKYYAQEKPMPADLKQVQRLIGARTKEEKLAVQTVLEEFFYLREDGWHQDRCDQTIEEFRAGEPEREAKKSNEELRSKRHREERARLFSLLNQAGIHAPWNTNITELRELVGKHCQQTETGNRDSSRPPITSPVTAPVTPVTATQTPDTNTQTPVLKPIGHRASEQPELTRGGPTSENVEKPEVQPTPAALLSQAMRKHGVMSNPGDPRLIALGNQGVTVETVEAACEEAKTCKPGERIGPAYVAAIIERWSKEAKAIDATGAKPPEQKAGTPPREVDRWWTSEQGITRRAKELGVRILPSHKWDDVKAICFDKERAQKEKAKKSEGATA